MQHTTAAYRVVHREDQGWQVHRDGEREPISRGFASQHSAVDYASGRAAHDHVELVIEDARGAVVETRPPPR